MAKTLTRMQMLEMLFVVPLVVVNVLPQKAVDPAHARASTIFRLSVSSVCVIGLVTLSIHKNRKAKVVLTEVDTDIEIFEDETPSDEREISLTFRSTPSAFWRCNTYGLARKNTLRIFFGIFGLVTAVLAARGLSIRDRDLALVAFPFLYVLSVAFWMGCTLLGLRTQFQQRYPWPTSVRVCKVRLTSKGFQDVTPDKTHFFEWSDVTDVREHQGDLYVWAKQGRGCYLPRESFMDREGSQRFHQAIVTLWQSRGERWPDDASVSQVQAAKSVPPPAPRAAADDNPYAAPASQLTFGPGAFLSNAPAVAGFLTIVFLLGCVLSFAYSKL